MGVLTGSAMVCGRGCDGDSFVRSRGQLNRRLERERYRQEEEKKR